MSDESIKSPFAPHCFHNLLLDYLGSKTRVKFIGSWLKKDKITDTHGKKVNIYIVYKLNKKYSIVNRRLVNCLFGAVKLTKHPDLDQYKYLGYGVGFKERSVYSFGNGFGRNVRIFVADMCSSGKTDNRKRDSWSSS